MNHLIQNIKGYNPTWPLENFKNVLKDASGGNLKVKKEDYLSSGKVPIIDQGQKLVGGYSDDKNVVCKSKPPLIIFGDHTRKIKYIDFEFAMGADGVKVLLPLNGKNAKFLYYFLKSLKIPETGYNRHFKYLKSAKIPIPPLPLQKQIAEILDTADALRRHTQAQLDALDELARAFFLEMFGDVGNNSKKWDLEMFGKLTINEDSKRIPVKAADRKKMQGEFDYYGATGVIDKVNDYIYDGKYLLVAEDGKALVNRNKPIAFQAKGKFWVNNHAHVVRFNGLADLTFLEYYFSFKNIRQYVTGIDQYKLNRSSLDRIPIFTPPLPLQTQFASIIKNIEGQKAELKAALRESEDLFGCLLQEVFG